MMSPKQQTVIDKELFQTELRVISAGVEGFAQALQQQSVPVMPVDWRPPADGKMEIVEISSGMTFIQKFIGYITRIDPLQPRYRADGGRFFVLNAKASQQNTENSPSVCISILGNRAIQMQSYLQLRQVDFGHILLKYVCSIHCPSL